MTAPSLPVPVSLDNCEAEPIHIPGSIQPHGVMLVTSPATFRIVQESVNAPAMSAPGKASLVGATLEDVLPADFCASLHANVEARHWKRFNPKPLTLNGRRFDGIVHRSGRYLVVELEPHDFHLPEGENFTADARAALMQMQRAESVTELAQIAAEEIRRITGYDRVMVYRFAEDLHGEVIAEDRAAALEPFLGLHYPASDIPAQARRLYTLNWLRIIADVEYQPAVVSGEPIGTLDMSHAVLRSVSPIHCEYLRNMGVRASMSVSLMKGDELWGLVACHHRSPKLVPYATRMACELIGQTLSTLTLSLEAVEASARQLEHSERRLRLVRRLDDAEFVGQALCGSDELLPMFEACGAVVLEEGRMTCVGDVGGEPFARALATALMQRNVEVFASDSVGRDLKVAVAPETAVAGVLAVGFPASQGDLVMWLRREQAREVTWAGNPEKVYAQGPHGPRLSPRGSFELWKEEVRGRSTPWSRAEREVAEKLRVALVETTVRRAHEHAKARDLVLGMVSHDLRNPLGAISVSAELLKHAEHQPETVNRVSARIAASSHRMGRMIEQLLDFTRASAGTMQLSPRPTDVAQVIREVCEELVAARPGLDVATERSGDLQVFADPDRLAQVVSNLVSNARDHGDSGRPITVRARGDAHLVQLEVHNWGNPIPPEAVGTIFEPFKRSRSAHASSRSGLGLGLFIVAQVVRAHGGTTAVTSSAEAGTTFTVTLPRRAR